MLIKWVVPVILLLCAFGVGVIIGMVEKDLFDGEDYDGRE